MLLEQCGIRTMKNDNLSLLSKSLYMISLSRSRTKKGQEKVKQGGMYSLILNFQF